MVAIISGHFTVSLTVKYPFFLTTSLSIEVNSLSHIHIASSHKSLMTWPLALDVVSFESASFLQLKLWQWQRVAEKTFRALKSVIGHCSLRLVDHSALFHVLSLSAFLLFSDFICFIIQFFLWSATQHHS